MKILHFIIGKGNKNRPNGVNQVIAGLCKYSSLNGQSIRVIGLASNADIEGEVIQRDGFQVEVYSKWSLKFLEALICHLKWCDILHLHGVYNWPNIIVGRIAKKYLTPFVITAHDGFAPARSKFRKKLFDFLVQKKFMEAALAIHVLAQEEATEILSVCKPNAFIFTPNGIDLDDFPIGSPKDQPDSLTRDPCKLVIGYLGRISEEKNLVSLVEGLANFEVDDSYILKLAGPKSPYLDNILALKNTLNIEWVGPKYGREKVEFISSLDLFIHPSKADVFSIAAMECLAIGTPLMITRASKASYFYNSGGFFMCESTSYGINHAINEALGRRDEWKDISKLGQSLILNTFNWNTASLSLIRGYESVLKDCK
ncbi:glycosyltransferase [Pseudomonadales bacterium]|nr:glycosyltransferase [Pseudomonadales bacterium]